MKNIQKWTRALLVMLAAVFVSQISLTAEAEARAGGKRSIGRSSSSGSAPSSYNRNDNRGGSPTQPGMPPQSRGGSLMRGMAAGVAGGFLGSMLFSSMGQAAGVGGSGAGGGGGIGLIEILLFAGLAYVAFRWWKGRQAQQLAPERGGAAFRKGGERELPTTTGGWRDAATEIDTDVASDLFFKVQGAWTRRDMSSIHGKLGPEMLAQLQGDADELKAAGKINRLENITVRRVEVLRTWNEDDGELCTVRFTANLLDYTVDETTSRVVDGSDGEPVKFEEDWTFARTRSDDWKLVGIAQA